MNCRPERGCSKRATRWIVVLLLCLLLSLPAFARSWRITDFRSTVAIDDQGYTTVTERIDLDFVGSFNGIWRTIPVEYPGPRGTNYSLFLKVESVTDGDGRSLKYEVSRDGDFKKIKIYVPGATDTTRTVLITRSEEHTSELQSHSFIS